MLHSHQHAEGIEESRFRPRGKLHSLDWILDKFVRLHVKQQHDSGEHNLRRQRPILLLHPADRVRFRLQHATEKVLPKLHEYHDFRHFWHTRDLYHFCRDHYLDPLVWLDDDVQRGDWVSFYFG